MTPQAPSIAPARGGTALLPATAALGPVGDEFLSLLDAVAAEAAGPPDGAGRPSAWTANAEGAEAGGDSPGFPGTGAAPLLAELGPLALPNLAVAETPLTQDAPAEPAAAGDEPAQAALDHAALPAFARPPVFVAPAPSTNPFAPQERAPASLVRAAGPFAGRGLFTTSDPAQAIRPGVDWIAVRPERLSDDLVGRIREAGIRLVVWEATASQQGIDAVRRYGADGYIAQAEGPGELRSAIAVADAIGVPKALVTNNFMDTWPPGWIAMPEAYSGQNPQATVERVVADSRIRGAQVVLPVLGLFSEGGRGPARLDDAARDLARVTVPGLAVFTVETVGDDSQVIFGGSVRPAGGSQTPQALSVPMQSATARWVDRPGEGGVAAQVPTPAPTDVLTPPAARDTGSEASSHRRAAASSAGRDPLPPQPSTSGDGLGVAQTALHHGGASPLAFSTERQGAARAAARMHDISRLHDLAERTQAMLRIVVDAGRTEARISLRPPDLGEVRIRLAYEPAGVSATVTADAAQAMEALAGAIPDLRRALEALGLSVLSLDVRWAGPQERPSQERYHGAVNGELPPRREPLPDEDEDPNADRRRRSHSDASLIDVLA